MKLITKQNTQPHQRINLVPQAQTGEHMSVRNMKPGAVAIGIKITKPTPGSATSKRRANRLSGKHIPYKG